MVRSADYLDVMKTVDELNYTLSVCETHLDGLHSKACFLITRFALAVEAAAIASLMHDTVDMDTVHALQMYWTDCIITPFGRTPMGEVLLAYHTRVATDYLGRITSDSPVHSLGRLTQLLLQAVRSFTWRVFQFSWLYDSGLFAYLDPLRPPPSFVFAADPIPGDRWDIAAALLIEMASTTPLRVVEIGVFRGRFSDHILRECPDVILIGVDPYEDAATVPPEFELVDVDDHYAAAMSVYSAYPDRAELVRERSTTAVNRLDNFSIDMVFIDGCHTSTCIEEDLRLWGLKVKPGGIVMGHDFSPVWPAVPIAVSQLRQGKELHLGMDLTWWFPIDTDD